MFSRQRQTNLSSEFRNSPPATDNCPSTGQPRQTFLCVRQGAHSSSDRRRGLKMQHARLFEQVQLSSHVHHVRPKADVATFIQPRTAKHCKVGVAALCVAVYVLFALQKACFLRHKEESHGFWYMTSEFSAETTLLAGFMRCAVRRGR